MTKDIHDAIDYILTRSGFDMAWCNDCGEDIREGADDYFIEMAKELAEWVKENCK
jgi:hypothetical protein